MPQRAPTRGGSRPVRPAGDAQVRDLRSAHLRPHVGVLGTFKAALIPSTDLSGMYFRYGGVIPYGFIVWDGPGTGYYEVTRNVRTNVELSPSYLQLEDVMGNTRIGTPRRLCVQRTPGKPCPGSGGVEGDPPTIEGSPEVSGEASNGTWSEGATVAVTLTFNEEVSVDTSAGTPSIGVALGGPGGTAKSAQYSSGSGSTALVFAYTLAEGDGAHSAMLVTGNSLALNGATIRSVATNADANRMRSAPRPVRSRTRGARTATGPMPVMISRSGRWPWRTSRRRPSSVRASEWPSRNPATSASTARASRDRAPLRSTSVNGSENVDGWESFKTLLSLTAYHSFVGEVEAQLPPRYAALTLHPVTNFWP